MSKSKATLHPRAKGETEQKKNNQEIGLPHPLVKGTLIATAGHVRLYEALAVKVVLIRIT
jgi:hypothetical protein